MGTADIVLEIERLHKENARLREQLVRAKALMQACVDDYYIASGKVRDHEGKDGYGSLRELRLFLSDD